MNSSSDGYNLAALLVEVFPDSAIDIIHEYDNGVVAKRVEALCYRLGKSVVDVMSMVEKRQFGELRKIKKSISGSHNLTPISESIKSFHGPPVLPSGASPPSPALTTSTVDKPPQVPDDDIIIVLDNDRRVPFTMKLSGTSWSVIEEEALERLSHALPQHISPRQRITLGCQYVDISVFVELTWHRAKSRRSRYTKFFVVPTDCIKDANVLISENVLRLKQPPDEGKVQLSRFRNQNCLD
jgi:hypothetical protein